MSVEFLESGTDAVLTADTRQWVNLPREGSWIDGHHVTSRHRVSQFPPFKVRFDRPGSHQFQARLSPGQNNSDYSSDELTRNPRFNHQIAPIDFTTDPDGTKIIRNFMVSAAGKDTYTIEAEDCHGNVVYSHEIETWRLVYYVTISMGGARSFSGIGDVEAEFERHGIKLVHLTTANMNRIPVIPPGRDADEEGFDAFIDAARRAYVDSIAPRKEDYILALCFVDQIGRKSREPVCLETDGFVRIGRGQGSVDLTVPGYGLWTQTVHGQSTRDAWFVRAEYFPQGFVPDPVTGQGMNIPPGYCTMVAHQSPLRNDVVTVRVDQLYGGRQAQARIKVWVNRLVGFSGGFAIRPENRTARQSNLIACATRMEWGPANSGAQKNFLIHEIGHSMGMVPNGEGGLPNQTTTFYDQGVEHRGPHCHAGISLAEAMRADNEGNATCVMFGRAIERQAERDGVEYNERFCEVCSRALRKVDLSRGWEPYFNR